MHRLGIAFVLALLVSSGPAASQSQTTCQWIGQVWTCNGTSQRSGIDWSNGRSGGSFNDSLRLGMEMGEAARRARDERDRVRAETELYRAQAEAVRAQGQQAPAPSSQPPANPDYLAQWMAAARPRMGLYPDFDKVVFAREVNITPDMVRLMTSSPMAADIAYYLATHRAEASAISQMPLLEAARAIDRIEGELKAGAND